MAQIQIPQPKPYIHQGPTVQPTHPVPGVSLPVLAQIAVPPNARRYQVAAPPTLHQGATKLSTDPMPPVTTRNLTFWPPTWNDPNRLALGSGNVGPDPQFEGATIQQTHPVPRSLLSLERYGRRPLQPDVKVPQDVTVVVVADTIGHQFDLDVLAWRYVARRASDLLAPPIDGPPSQATFVFPPNQPDLVRAAVRHVLRFVVATTRPIEGPTVQGDAVLKAPVTPDVRWCVRPAQPLLLLPQDVAIVVVADTLLGRQPESVRRMVVRTLAEVTPHLLGATNDETFVFPVNQLERRRFVLLDISRYDEVASLSGWLGPDAPPIPPTSGPRIILVEERLAIRLKGVLYGWLN